ncbi:MAG TPA: NAD-dependent epimerase/dehydratase family protein [Clostridiales bacterium]|nr:NAD-dependent epimerase/dehydratase family protein [Clostridiales bacterium]
MDKKISVITGASGHIGYALAKELDARGQDFRMLIRSDSKVFDGIKAEKVFGDVTDPKSLEEAFEGAHTVYHLAGVIDVGNDKDDFLRLVNVQGTVNVVEACKKAGVKRLVYASSVDAVEPLPGNELMTENTYISPEKVSGVYGKTKAEATRYVLDNAGEDLEAVAIYPSACIGPYDFKVSAPGEMVRMIMKGKLPVSLSFGGYNFVDVRDVAIGMIGAAEQGKAGESYFLTGNMISAEELIKLISEKSGRKAPKIRMSLGVAKALAPLAEVYYKISGASPLFTRLSIEILNNNCNFSHEKASSTFGYSPRTLEQSIEDMVCWISETEGIALNNKCCNN